MKKNNRYIYAIIFFSTILLFIVSYFYNNRDGSIRYQKLNNGLTIATTVVKNKNSVGIVATVNTGSTSQNGKTGVAHFLEHMAFRSTKKYQNGKVIEILNDKASYYHNAITSYYQIKYIIQSLKEDLDIMLDVLSDMLMNPMFKEEELEIERNVVLKEIQSYYANPKVRADIFLNNKIYENSKCQSQILYGTIEDIKSINKKDLTNYMNTYFYGGNMMISIAGDMSHSKMIKMVKKHFSNLPKGNQTAPLTDDMDMYKSYNKNKYTLVTKQDKDYKNMVTMSIMLRGDYPWYYYKWEENIKRTKNDYSAYDFQIFKRYMSDGMNSILFKEVREKRGLVYHIEFNNNRISFNTSPDKLVEAYNVVIDVITNNLEKPIDESDFSNQVQRYKTDTLCEDDVQNTESPTSKASFAINGYLSYGDTLFDQVFYKNKIKKAIIRFSSQNTYEATINMFNENFIQSTPVLFIYGDFDEKNIPDYKRLDKIKDVLNKIKSK